MESTLGDETDRKNHSSNLHEYSSLLDTSLTLQHHTSRKPATLSKPTHLRVKSTLGPSRYANISSENLKFDSFIDALFASKMTHYDIRSELKSYVNVIETNYNDTIRDLKSQLDRL
jgi:hypothetical protein